MPLNMQFLWAVPHATNKTADRILRDQVEHTVSPASAHIRGTLAVRNIILLIHNNVSLRTCPEAKGKATKDLGIDEILFTWHRRKLLQKCSLWERGILNKWIFEKGAVFYTDISYWRLFPLPWTFPSYIFSWHCDLTSLPLSPFASQPFFFFFPYPQGTGVPWGSSMSCLYSPLPSVLTSFCCLNYHQHMAEPLNAMILSPKILLSIL